MSGWGSGEVETDARRGNGKAGKAIERKLDERLTARLMRRLRRRHRSREEERYKQELEMRGQ